MNKYEEIYSEFGLEKMIKNNKEKIKEKEKELQEISEGNLFNPHCADGLKKEIQREIKILEGKRTELKEAIRLKKNN